MENLLPIVALILILGWLVTTLFFVARCIAALFSRETRLAIRRHPLLHLLWAGIAVLILPASFVGSTPNLPAALRAQNENLVAMVETGYQNYTTEYGYPPSIKDDAMLTKQLTGDNRRNIPFISLRPSQSNVQGELLDAYKTPYRFYLTKSGRLIVHSAGPDKKWNTGDDMLSDGIQTCDRFGLRYVTDPPPSKAHRRPFLSDHFCPSRLFD